MSVKRRTMKTTSIFIFGLVLWQINAQKFKKYDSCSAQVSFAIKVIIYIKKNKIQKHFLYILKHLHIFPYLGSQKPGHCGWL